MSPRISMITLGVRDLEVAINFYEQGLGFPRKKSSPDIAFFTLNGTWLALYNWDALARDAGVDSSGTGFGGFTLSHNVMSEKEVDKVYAAALAAEASPVKKPQPASWIFDRYRFALGNLMRLTDILVRLFETDRTDKF